MTLPCLCLFVLSCKAAKSLYLMDFSVAKNFRSIEQGVKGGVVICFSRDSGY